MISKLHYISQGDSPQAHLKNITQACEAGADLVQLRLKNCPEAELLAIAEQAREITTRFNTKLIINDFYKIAKSVNADGVHLGKTDTCPTIARAYLHAWQIIGGTANTIEDCENLINKSVDYIGLGPFRYTTTKSNLSPVLGIKGYSEIIDTLKNNTPIIAVGGITSNDVSDILKTGIYGVAISGEITRNFESIKTYNQLLNPSLTEEIQHTSK